MRKMIPFLTIAVATVVLPGILLAQDGPNRERPRGPEAVFERFDANQDGKLTADELPERAKERLQQADKNKDGVVTFDELKARFQERRGAGPKGERPQMYGKGQRPGPPHRPDPAKIFERLDTNNDKVLNLEEFTDGMKMLHQRIQRHRMEMAKRRGPQGQRMGPQGHQHRGPGNWHGPPPHRGPRGY